jgi:hypothetical protein
MPDGLAMAKRLRVWLPDSWSDVTGKVAGGTFAAAWNDEAASGALQVSTAEFKGGPEPRPGQSQLMEMAVDFGRQHDFGKLDSSSSGKCVMGLFGTAAFKRKFWKPRSSPFFCQVWFLSNGLDFVFVTFIAETAPDKEEVTKADLIARAIEFD